MIYWKRVFLVNRTTTDGTKQYSIFRGLIFSMLSGLSYSIVSLIVKHMKNLHPGQLAIYNFTSIFVMSMPGTVKTRQNPLGPPKLRLFVMLRGVLGGLNTILNFIAFQYLSLGEASVIIFSSPVIVTTFARVFLKEPCSILQSLAVVLTLLGIAFTTKLPSRLTEAPVEYSGEQLQGLLAAIFSLFCVSTLILITRKVRCVHVSILNFHYGWLGVMELATLTAVFGNFQLLRCGIQSVYVLLLALFSFSGRVLMVMALQSDYAGPVITMRAAVDIGLAFLWQILIFQDVPDIYGIMGAVLILVSVILISLSKWLSSSQDNWLLCGKFNCF